MSCLHHGLGLLQLPRLQLRVEGRLHLLLELGLELGVGVHGSAHGPLHLDLGGRLGGVIQQLGLLGECQGQTPHGEDALGHAAWQLGGRGVQAGGVLHRRPFGRVVLLLGLLLPRDLDRLGVWRHPTCGTGTESREQPEEGGGEDGSVCGRELIRRSGAWSKVEAILA